MLLDLIWPRRCELCSRLCDRPRRHVYWSCLAKLPVLSADGCEVCGRDIGGAYGRVCDDCKGQDRPHFDRAASALRFEGDAREMVLDYKFHGHIWIRDDLVDWLEGAVRARFAADAIDLVLPMPITFWHRIDRGYNQCEYLADALARRIRRKCDARILRRTGSPRRQAGLSREERLVNVIGTFAVSRPELVRGRTILVVDDVMTTGATLSECSKTLKQAGAWRVWCATVARPSL